MDYKFFICENINIFGYLGARGMGRGGGGFNNQTGPILVHIYPLYNNNLQVKYRSNLIRTSGVKIKNMKNRGHVGPLHKKPGVPGAPTCQQMQTSLQWRPMYNKGKPFENQFFIYGPKCKIKCIFWAIWGAPEGIFNDQTGPILLSGYPLTNIYVHV